MRESSSGGATVSDSTDGHIADAIAAIRDESRRWSALVRAREATSRAAVRRTCLLVTALSAVLLLGAVAAASVAAKLALGGTLIAVPIFVAVLGLSGSLSLYVVGAAVAYRSVASGRALPARVRVIAAVTMTGQTLSMGTALATALAGVLVAVNGLPSAAVLAAGVAGGVAVLGRKIATSIQQSATA
jgi:hypothetical protein